MSIAQRKTPRFKVGEWVSFHYGPQEVWAQVIEDRGALGVNHRRLYRVRLDEEFADPVAFEVPEDDLVSAQLDQKAVVDYLTNGGLLSILRSNVGGGRDQPRAWLTFDRRGRVTHTFNEERGLIGGATVPFFALQGNAIFTPKEQEIVKFLSSFGLSVPDVEKLIRSIDATP